MRHRDREIKDPKTVIAMLERASVGRMATINRKGVPVIKPVNFLYRDGKVYIHSSLKGEKIGDIRKGSPVCFEVDEPVAYVAARGPACTATYKYQSLILKGRASLIGSPQKKLEILDCLMAKYQPEGGYEEIPKEILKKTAVIEISVDEMTAKGNLGR
jgi:uncharacterized protein